MPAVSRKQQRFMGAELARKRAGQATRTGMSASQLEEFATMMHAKHKMPMKSHMPKGGKQSPSGDLGALRQAEARAAGGSKFKGTKDAGNKLK